MIASAGRVCLALALVSACTADTSQAQTSPARIVPGTAIQRTALVNDIHNYEVELEAGDAIDVRATQEHFEIGLAVRAPDGVQIGRVRVTQVAPLAQAMTLVASTSGPHVIQIELAYVHSEAPSPQPTYTLDVGAKRTATDADRDRARLTALANRASDLVRLRTLDGIREAIPLFQQVAGGWRVAGDDLQEATTLTSLVKVTGLFTQFRVASASGAARLVELWAALGDRPRARDMWRKLGIEHQDDGRIEDAMRATERAVALSRDLGDRAKEGADLRMVSWMAIKLGNYDEARKMAGQALAIATEIADPTLEAWVLLNLARLQELSGDTVGATRHYERALTLGASDAFLIGATRMSLGFLLLRGGDFDGAQRAFEARLDLARRIVQRDGEALARIGLGDTVLARGDRAAARLAYDAADAVLIKTGFVEFRCIVTARLGRLDLLEDAVDRAAERFQQVIVMAAEIQSPACEAQGRGGLADVAAQRGDLEQAAADARRGVELTELFRTATAGLDSRSFGFPALAPAYERAIDLHMRLAGTREASPEAARALELNEQALARGLLDALAVEQLERRAAISPTLDAERRRLREDWRARALEHEVAVRRGDAQRKQVLADEMTRLTTSLRDVESRIDVVDARHASLVRPTPLDAPAIQQLLDADTTLVEYALGDARSFAWVITTDAIRTVTLAPRADIEAIARRLHLALSQTPARPLSASARQAGGAADAQHAMQQDAVRLSELVLRPLASTIATPRVAIVASGALSLVPFGMLPGLSESTGRRVEGPWLTDREVLNLPSATVLSALRKLALQRPRAHEGIAVFADPVYDTRDPRLAATNSGARRASDTPQRPGEARGLELARLPFSRTEADAILHHAPSPTLTLTGVAATRERALDRDLARYRIVHFATHGVVHPDVPNLSGIVLSLTDERGQPRNGFVLLPDVYEMSLNADLVVLSACQTALGTPLRGEGLIGLTRGFMYAGASRVVASLWRVDDEATAALMAAFYRGMLREGLPVSAALRAAQLEVRKTRRWSAPYYWAGFVLQGDWK